MLLNEYLNESTFGFQDVETISESWVTGGDTNEILSLTNDYSKAMNTLDENFLYTEALAHVAILRESVDKAELLMENAFKDYLAKAKKAILNLWAKIKDFFAKLFKKIQISLMSIDKSLKNIDKYLNKDFSEFKYMGNKWTDNDVANKISANAKALLNTADVIKNSENNSERELNIYATLLDIASGSTTAAQAKLDIQEKYGYSDIKEEITGFDKTKIVDFLKNFNKNKTILDLKKNSDENFKKILKNFTEAENKATTDEAKKAAKLVVEVSNQIVKAYNVCMSTCINLETKRFKEYKSVLKSAISYNPKSK